MRAVLALVPATALLVASCGTAGSVSAPDDSGSTTGAGSGGPAPTCRPTCTTAADCGVPGDPLYDSSHFTCQAGQCAWQGCASAAACSAEAHGGNFLCQATGGEPASCVPACQQPSDCVPSGTSGAGLEDASHFACTAGACVWLGCQSTAECVTAVGTSKVSCEAPAGAPAPTCVPTCTTPADCVMQGGSTLDDASHYACTANRCQWLGCKSTTDCTEALSSSKYVCE